MRFILSLVLCLAAISGFAQGSVRRIPTLTRLLAIDPRAVATGDSIVFLVDAPSTNASWGGPRFALWSPATNLVANGTNVFTSPYGGQWVFQDRDSAIQDARWYSGTNNWSLDKDGNLVLGTTNVVAALANTIQNPPPDTVIYGRQNNGGTNVAWVTIPGGGGGGATNASQVKINSGAYFPIANLLDTVELAWTNNGGAIYGRVKPSSISQSLIAPAYTTTVEARANHTGTQTAATISDFVDQVWAKIKASIINGTGIDKVSSDASQTLTVSLGSHTHTGPEIASGYINMGRLGTGTPTTNTFLRGDGSWAIITTNGTSISSTGSVLTVKGVAAPAADIQDTATVGWTYAGGTLTADLLAGSLGTNILTSDANLFYLNRTNHFGTQPIASLQYATNLVQGSSNNVYGGSNVFNGVLRSTSTAQFSGAIQSSGSANFNTITVSNALLSPYSTDGTTFKAGFNAVASANYGTAIGYSPSVTGIGGIGIGAFPSVTNYAVGIGYQPVAAGYAISGGFQSSATGGSSIALGRSPTASGALAVSIGYQSVSDADAAISILGHSHGLSSISLNGYANGDNAIALLGTSSAYGISFGLGSLAGLYDIAIGNNALATNTYSVSVGPSTVNRKNYSTALGYASATTKDHQIALGTTGDEVWIPSILVINTTNVIEELGKKVTTNHVHDGTQITSGYVSVNRMGSGTPTTNTFLRGDGVWASITTNGSTVTAPNAITWDGNYVTNILSGTYVLGGISGQQVTVDVDTNKVGLLARDQTWTGIQTFTNTVTMENDLYVPSGSLVSFVSQTDNFLTYATAIVPNPTNAWVAVWENNPAYGHELMYSAPLSLIQGGNVWTSSNNVFTGSTTFSNNVAVVGSLVVNGTNVLEQIGSNVVQLAQGKLAGRGATNGTGGLEAVAVGSSLKLDDSVFGPTLDLADADWGDITTSDTGTAWTINNGSVTYAKMQNVASTSRLLGRGTLSTGPPQELTATLPLVITNTTITVADGSVSLAKLAATSTNSVLLGRGAGVAGVPQEITLGTGFSMVGQQLRYTASASDSTPFAVAAFTARNEPGDAFPIAQTLDGANSSGVTSIEAVSSAVYKITLNAVAPAGNYKRVVSAFQMLGDADSSAVYNVNWYLISTAEFTSSGTVLYVKSPNSSGTLPTGAHYSFRLYNY